MSDPRDPIRRLSSSASSSPRARAPRLASARARGRVGGRKPKMTAAKLRLAMASMGKRETNVGALCEELGDHAAEPKSDRGLKSQRGAYQATASTDARSASLTRTASCVRWSV